jgi:hypothetical protein
MVEKCPWHVMSFSLSYQQNIKAFIIMRLNAIVANAILLFSYWPNASTSRSSIIFSKTKDSGSSIIFNPEPSVDEDE